MDIATRGVLLVFGAAFFGVAVIIKRMQNKAASCDLHNPRAGALAMVFAILSNFAGCTLVAAALLVW